MSHQQARTGGTAQTQKPAIVVRGLSKRYGAKQALQDVSFSVKPGSCFGLLGPNGAGKSTTMKILTGLIDHDGGNVEVLGLEIPRELDALRPKMGYVPQAITLYEKLSAIDNLRFFGEMYGLRGKHLLDRVNQVLQHVGLQDRATDQVEKFSGGMKRRINIAAALLHQPKVLILDEPTVGIDPQSRNHIFEMIRSLTESGITVLYSTHYMEEVEALCDELAIIDEGRVITHGTIDEVLQQSGKKSVYVEADGLAASPVVPGLERPVRDGKGWRYEGYLDVMAALVDYLKNADMEVKRLEVVRPSLESVFLSLTGTNLRDE